MSVASRSSGPVSGSGSEATSTSTLSRAKAFTRSSSGSEAKNTFANASVKAPRVAAASGSSSPSRTCPRSEPMRRPSSVSCTAAPRTPSGRRSLSEGMEPASTHCRTRIQDSTALLVGGTSATEIDVSRHAASPVNHLNGRAERPERTDQPRFEASVLAGAVIRVMVERDIEKRSRGRGSWQLVATCWLGRPTGGVWPYSHC